MIVPLQDSITGIRRKWTLAAGRSGVRERLHGFRLLSVFGGQGAISLQTFVGAMLMIRNGTQSQFGLYTTMLAGINSVAALHFALAIGPMLVITPGRPLLMQRSMAGSFWLLNAFLSLAIVLFTIASYKALTLSGSVSGGYFKAIVAACAYFLIYKAQEFFRRVLQIHEEFFAASVCDFAALVVVCLAIPVLRAVNSSSDGRPTLTATGALLIMSLSGLAGLLPSVYQSRRYFAYERLAIRHIVNEAWAVGSWSLVQVTSDFLCNYASTYIVAGTLGTAAVGRLEGPRLLVAPIQVFSNAIRNYLIPTLSGLIASGKVGEAGRKLRTGFLWTGIVVGGYCVVIGSLPDAVTTRLFGAVYAGSGNLMRWWAAFYFLLILFGIPTVVIYLMRRVKTLAFFVFAIGCAISAGTWVASRHGSLAGVLAVRVTGSLILMLFAILFASHLIKTSTSKAAS